MKRLPFLRFALPIALILGFVACDNDELTGANRSAARVSVEAPDNAKTGDNFEVQINVENVGLSNIRTGRVDATFAAPLSIISVGTSPGTNATFSNGLTGGRVTWDLGTLDSNSQSRLTVQTIGTLAPGEASRRATIEASLTGQSIAAGDAVARDEVTINP